MHLADGFWKPQLLSGPALYFWVYDLVAWVVLPSLAIGILHAATTISGRDYGLSAPLGWKDIAYITPLPLVGLFLCHFFGGALTDALLRPTYAGAFSYSEPLRALGSLWIFGTVYLSATAGLWESIFYVGLPWFAFSSFLTDSGRGRSMFALLTAALFAIGHHENGLTNAGGAFFFQLAAALTYFKLRTLWPIIGAHALIDVYSFWPWSYLIR